LTFKTTSLPLFSAIRPGGPLREYIPARPLAEQKRWLLVTPEIEDLLTGRTLSGIFPNVNAELLIGRYAAGHLLTISREKTKKKPDFEQLVGFNEVWALCPRMPRPGWRILGRFYEKDVLVLSRAWEKKKLFGHYTEAAAEIEADWIKILGNQPAHTGNDIGDYLSGVFKDVDEKI
jgi:hypothetical protein